MTVDKSNQIIIIISSPSGAGKTTLCKHLLESDEMMQISISDTTRPARDNEIDGKHYNFVSQKEFNHKIKNNLYIEYANVFGNFYGSLRSSVDDHFNNNFDVLFDIDWQGASQLKKSGYPNILSIFIVPPSKEEIKKRLMMRSKTSGDNEDAINNRLKMFELEMKHQDEYDYVIVNDSLEKCVSQIQNKIELFRNNLTY